MLTGPDDTSRLDRLCVAGAVLMALHCLLAPLLAPRMPVLSGNAAHLLLALALLALSVPATIRGWMEHRDGRVLAWTLPAWGLLAAARIGGDSLGGEVAEVLVTVAAAVLLVVAHQLNRSLTYWHHRP